MDKKYIIWPRIILMLSMLLCFTIPATAHSGGIDDALLGCCKCITDCANNAILFATETLTSVSTGTHEDYYSDYPEGYDPYDPIAMGEVDPWEAYRAQQEEEMDRAMAEEAQRAWQEYNEPQPDISDRIIKP